MDSTEKAIYRGAVGSRLDARLAQPNDPTKPATARTRLSTEVPRVDRPGKEAAGRAGGQARPQRAASSRWCSLATLGRAEARHHLGDAGGSCGLALRGPQTSRYVKPRDSSARGEVAASTEVRARWEGCARYLHNAELACPGPPAPRGLRADHAARRAERALRRECLPRRNANPPPRP